MGGWEYSWGIVYGEYNKINETNVREWRGKFQNIQRAIKYLVVRFMDFSLGLLCGSTEHYHNYVCIINNTLLNMRWYLIIDRKPSAKVIIYDWLPRMKSFWDDSRLWNTITQVWRYIYRRQFSTVHFFVLNVWSRVFPRGLPVYKWMFEHSAMGYWPHL